MLSDEFTAVSACGTTDELHKAILRFAGRLGFDKIGAGAVVDGPTKRMAVRAVDNAPPAYHDQYESPSNARRDPVMQHCRFSALPIVWDQAIYIAAGCGDKWEAQGSFGYKTGIAVALHLQQGRHFYIGFDRDQSLPSNGCEITRMAADLQLFAVLAHEAAFRVLWSDNINSPGHPSLTPRELETLRWTMEGKT